MKEHNGTATITKNAQSITVEDSLSEGVVWQDKEGFPRMRWWYAVEDDIARVAIRLLEDKLQRA